MRHGDTDTQRTVVDVNGAPNNQRAWWIVYIVVIRELRRLYPYARRDQARLLFWQGLGWDVTARLGTTDHHVTNSK